MEGIIQSYIYCTDLDTSKPFNVYKGVHVSLDMSTLKNDQIVFRFDRYRAYVDISNVKASRIETLADTVFIDSFWREVSKNRNIIILDGESYMFANEDWAALTYRDMDKRTFVLDIVSKALAEDRDGIDVYMFTRSSFDTYSLLKRADEEWQMLADRLYSIQDALSFLEKANN